MQSPAASDKANGAKSKAASFQPQGYRNCEPFATAFRSLFAPERSVDECLLFLGTIMHRAPVGSQDWTFADRIAHQAARPLWEIGPAQLAYLRKLVDRYAPDGIAIDPDLIDGAVPIWTAEKVQKNPPCEVCGAEKARQHLVEGIPHPHWLCTTHEGFFSGTGEAAV